MTRATWAILAALTALWIGGAVAAENKVMRYVRVEHQGSTFYGLLEGETIHRLAGGLFDPPERTGLSVALSDVTLLPPSEPTKVLAVGLNFRSHAGESGAAHPELFAKLPSAMVGHDAPIHLPPGAANPHYEGELVVVIGKRAKNVSVADAPAYVFGVTAGNDVSERGWQASDLQWLRAKASDGFAPVGPAIATGLDYKDLLIETRLNGAVQQSESSKFLIHDVDEIVSFTSRYITLEPGDLIFCGTPGRTRPMKPGDVVEITIQGVGTLRNKVVAN